MNIQTITLAAGTVLLSLMATTSAYAKDFDVRYSQAELKTPAGAEQVYHRIYDVAEDLCDYEFSHSFATKSRLRFERCLRRTVKEYVGQVDHPNVDTIYAALPKRRSKDRLIQPYKAVKNQRR